MNDIASPPSPRLEVRDLRVVLALAAARTTGQAATLLHVTQPAVSRALLAAESKLGARLFERTPRGLVPTAAGEQLLSGATRLLLELRELEHSVRTPAPKPLALRLVCECYTAYHWLPSVLSALRQRMPGLELKLAIEHTSAPIEALSAGEIDVALLTTAAVPRPLEERALFSDEVVLVISSRHPLATKKALTLSDLKAYPLLTSNVPAAEARWFMKRVFGRARPRLQLERLPLTEAILDVARAGMGIAVLSEWIAGPHLERGELVAKRLASGAILRPWRLAWRREVGDAALRLLSVLQASVPHARLVG